MKRQLTLSVCLLVAIALFGSRSRISDSISVLVGDLASRPRLTTTRVIELANAEAFRLGVDLSRYDMPTVGSRNDGELRIWQVTYEGKEHKYLDNCFWMEINDLTETAELHRCG
jgi:hypothetical protein